jgi:hypothetical protein
MNSGDASLGLAALSANSEQSSSGFSLPEHSSAQSMLVTPGAWRIHCSGCNVPAPENDPDDSTGTRSTVGCRCLICPEWFACLSCAEREEAAHKHQHANHVTYRVTLEHEQYTAACALQSFSRFKFTFEALFWPFLKMFLPCVSVLVQVWCLIARLPVKLAPLFPHSCPDVLVFDQRSLHRQWATE